MNIKNTSNDEVKKKENYFRNKFLGQKDLVTIKYIN